ncbi:2-oxo-3-hexenedioate decarboxylase [Comamonas sp. BIGb0124]|uniref:2-keto-4-pentenoate hydratase n=1 Tax=Comamonas sp. BIGb0124 TaxID=2485130 RepID=UPI000F8FF12D|nr:fumarylacetoacetate hydrolase family protein [Comamonas sp. BIGb0124]ROR21491.1 2-oxo-3-hexenedioate decarboxylase [Comamonas sp. BIGb0124]
MLTDQQLSDCAAELLAARTAVRTLRPVSHRYPGVTLDEAYEIDARVHRLRLAQGAVALGRKIGLTNTSAWRKLGVEAPVWSSIYGHSVIHWTDTRGRLSLAPFLAPRIEPEVVVHFREAPDVSQGEEGVLAAIDWIASGYEIVQSNYDSKDTVVADTVANSVFHGCLVVGPQVAVSALSDGLAEDLKHFSLLLSRDGVAVEKGEGRQVLGSPLQSILALARVLAAQSRPPIAAGEIVTTGTITTAYPVEAGQTWHSQIDGLDLTGLSIEFTA